jgi:RNA recognition motif-containing protein
VVPSNLYPLKKEGAMGSKLFVEGLPPSFSTRQLKDLFAPFGTVLSALVIIDPAGKSLRMGKVEMSTPREAERAIQKLHRSHVQGEFLLVFKQVNQGGSTAHKKKGAP